MSTRRRQNTKRSGTRSTTIACAIVGFGLCLASPIAAGVKPVAETHFESALEQMGSATVEQSLKALRDVLNSDRDCAPAHYETAKLYMSLDTPMDRQSARNALDEAIRLEPRSGDCQMALGELLRKQGLWLSAERHYEKIYENFPEHRAQAAYMVGFFPCELS